jgi:hypothetical protein
MLYISLFFSLLMLVVVNGLAWCSSRFGDSTCFAWLFLLVGLCPVFFLPTFLLNVILVALASTACCASESLRRRFAVLSLAATVVSYGVGAIFGVAYMRERENRYPNESLDERLSYESRREELPGRLGLLSPGEQQATFDQDRLAKYEIAIEESVYSPSNLENSGTVRPQALKELHENHVEQFIQSPSFGVARMFGPRMWARPGDHESISMPLLSSGNWNVDRDRLRGAGPGWLMHCDSLSDFLYPARFGYVKDRRHVAGFQSHQFAFSHAYPAARGEAPAYRLERLELVSLLKHERPGVYVTENLPRMDELVDVPIRPLNVIEANGLRRLWQGDDLVSTETIGGLRVLGSLRAGKQCLTCHDARRGDLLGAFSYHLVAEH